MINNTKTVLIIGGSHGIGAGIVESMAIEGYNVIFTYRSRKKEAQLLQERLKSNYNVRAMYGDFTNKSNIEQFLCKIPDIDILIINAAVNHKEKLLTYTVENFNYMMTNNLYMPFLFCQLLAQNWISKGKKGKIINISSIRGETPQIGRVGYCCSKAALNMLTKCEAYELAEYGITVNAVAVGLTALGMNEKLANFSDEKWVNRVRGIPLGRTGTGNDIGGVVVFLASHNSDWITGQIFVVDGGHQLVTF